VGLVRRRFPLAALGAGIHAGGAPGQPSTLKQLVHGADDLRTLGLELATRRSPFVDLPPCLGGAQLTPPAAPAATFVKAAACHACWFDTQCPGASNQLDVVGSAPWESTLRPLSTWQSYRRSPRVLVLSSLGGDPLFYISTLPALGEALRQRGLAVEVVSPWSARWCPDE